MYGTPVLGANIGGVPELIQDGKTGELFESGNQAELQEKVLSLWNDRQKQALYSQNCNQTRFASVDEYCAELLNVYAGQV